MELLASFLFPAAIRWLHLIAAITWVGGTIFLTVVVAPLARRELPEGERLRIVALVGRRFNVVAWAAIAVLLTTGVYNSWYKLRTFEALFGSFYGTLLLVKLAVVAVIIVLTWIHAYRLAPRLEALARAGAEPGEGTFALQRRIISLSAVHLILNLAVVFIAALLTYY